MSDDLADFLDAIDPHLVEYLDATKDISCEAVRHVQCYAVAMLQGLIVPEHVHEDWPDFYPLVDAFVMAHGSRRLACLSWESCLFEGGGDDPITESDRGFLLALLAEIHAFLTVRRK
jgi:hypothetical protein